MSRILDWNKYLETAALTAAEGIVMLRNENGALPVDINEEIAVFGRIQLHYYKSGTGSGGMVNVSKVTSVIDGLIENGAKLNEKLLGIYRGWDAENPFDLGSGWGGEPWSQKEMPVSDELAAEIARTSRTALVIFGRTAGEEQDNFAGEGSYMLSSEELDVLRTVRANFEKVVVLLNVGNIIDMNFVEDIKPDSVLYLWQGGMTGGKGAADVITGRLSPCGKLPDTIARSIADYPSNANFGGGDRDIYCEDIYVGYRYFDTFAPEKVLYPFGFGLSYTTFRTEYLGSESDCSPIKLSVRVTNTGSFSGKEVVMIFCQKPQGRLGQPKRVLCGYEKTKNLAPNESQELSIAIDFDFLASYDDSGVTGHKSCWVYEKGVYEFFITPDVGNCFYTELTQDSVKQQCVQAMAPVVPFERMVNRDGLSYESVPLNEVDEAQRRLEGLPQELPVTGDRGIKLADVACGKNTMDEFIAQLSDGDLACIIRGEGMGSPRVTPGTASAFGGVSDGLVSFGIPAACCSDGPSGMRLDCGTKAFSLPNGTLIASTFNRELVRELFTFMGLEMTANNVECLLGPGMNIHRHPLNGRNFEYFSEDPYLTGTMAVSELQGLHSAGVEGTVKHFCANNRETRRHCLDSVVSERALREIYLKGFEMAVKDGGVQTIMTTYGSVNGLWTAGNYDLNTTVLRNEWGYTGLTMTDWWSDINIRGQKQSKTDLATMAIAQNDLYMVCADGSDNNDNTLEELHSGRLTLAELQRNAANICRFIIGSNAFKRGTDEFEPVEIIGRGGDSEEENGEVEFYDLDGAAIVEPEKICTDKGCSYSFAMIVRAPGYYRVTITASSTQSALAQIPVTLFAMGTASGTFTWNGTGGEPVSFSTEIPMFSRYTTIRLYFAQSGLDLHSVSFDITDRSVDIDNL